MIASIKKENVRWVIARRITPDVSPFHFHPFIFQVSTSVPAILPSGVRPAFEPGAWTVPLWPVLIWLGASYIWKVLAWKLQGVILARRAMWGMETTLFKTGRTGPGMLLLIFDTSGERRLQEKETSVRYLIIPYKVKKTRCIFIFSNFWKKRRKILFLPRMIPRSNQRISPLLKLKLRLSVRKKAFAIS